MKNFDVEKYADLLQGVLNKLNTRKGDKIAWTEFAKANKVSSSFGTALMRIGLVEKVDKNTYRSSTSVYYITRKHAVSIANVINDSNILSNLTNDTVLVSAKDALMKLGIVRVANKQTNNTVKVKAVKQAKVIPPSQPTLFAAMQPVQATKPTQPTQPVQATKPTPAIVATRVPANLPNLSNYSTQEILREIGKRIAR